MALQVGPKSNFTGKSRFWTPRWYPLKHHPVHARLRRTTARFTTVPAGRRSGKTEIAKRYGVLLAYRLPADSLVGFGAPTFQQAKNIFWKDLKAMVHPMLVSSISETELTIVLITGTEIRVVGMDKPARVEGQPWDWLCLDEFANMKATAWSENVYPALSTVGRFGKAWLIGVPEGRNHYYELDLKARTDTSGTWASYTWKSAEILPPHIVDEARRDLDPLTFAQEYEATFVNFAGQTYYEFGTDTHVVPIRQKYNPRGTLMLCFDFNVEPGTASVVQYVPHRYEISAETQLGSKVLNRGKTQTIEEDVLGVIGEVWIPRNSNTPAVCRKILEQWGDHEGRIELYGDATGGARKTSSESGTDWDLILRDLGAGFGRDRVKRRGNQSENGHYINPSERARINAMNSRLRTADGRIGLLVDPSCVETVKDFEGVRYLQGGAGEIDKKHDPMRTHLTDGIGYAVEKLHSTKQRTGFRVTSDVF